MCDCGRVQLRMRACMQEAIKHERLRLRLDAQQLEEKEALEVRL